MAYEGNRPDGIYFDQAPPDSGPSAEGLEIEAAVYFSDINVDVIMRLELES